MIAQKRQQPPKQMNALQQKIRLAIQEASSTGMGEREIVEMTRRLIQEKQGGKRK